MLKRVRVTRYLQNYFTKLLEDRTKCVIKPQYVDHIPKVSPSPHTTAPSINTNSLLFLRV